jgi:hypothetical protein
MSCRLRRWLDFHSPQDEEEVRRFERLPHAVAFMLPVSELDDPDSELMQHLRKQFEEIVRMGINPLVLLAKIDDQEEEFRKDPLAPNKAQTRFVKEAHKLLAIPKGNIYCACNYLEAEKKSFNLDRNLWLIIHRLASQW